MEALDLNAIKDALLGYGHLKDFMANVPMGWDEIGQRVGLNGRRARKKFQSLCDRLCKPSSWPAIRDRIDDLYSQGFSTKDIQSMVKTEFHIVGSMKCVSNRINYLKRQK